MTERDRFLREFDKRLRLRGKRRADAVAEIESHIADAVEAGEDEAAAIARLGDPREIARAVNRTDARRSRVLIAAAGLIFATATTVAAGWFQWDRSTEEPARAFREHRQMAPPEVAIPVLEREWRETIEVLARAHPEERFANPSDRELRERLALAARRYAFAVERIRIERPLQRAPFVVVRTNDPETFADNVPAIWNIICPRKQGANDDRTGWRYEGFFFKAVDSEGIPFLVVHNHWRGPDGGGGTWARSEDLLPFGHL